MATGLVPLEKLQFGLETTPGTLVPATKVYIAEDGGEFTPELERQAVEEVRGVLAVVEDFDVRAGSLLNVAGVLDFEQCLLAFETGLATVAPVGVGPYTRTYTPSLTAPNAVKAATFEVAYTDGTTKHVEREFGFGQCSKFNVELAFNAPARFNAEFFARADQASTLTPALSPITREIARSNAFNVYIDPTWALLGTTEVTAGLVRSATLEVMTGIEQQYGIDSRTNLDFGTIQRGMITGSLAISMAVNSGFAAEFEAWRAGTVRFIRLKAAGSAGRLITFDMAGRYTSVKFGRDGNLRTADLTFEFRYDPTSAKVFQAEVVNSLATFT